MASGILISKVIGFVRLKLLSRYLGTTDEGAAFAAAFRIPNFLQNLLGEGVLAGSFVPVYATLLGEGKKEEADKLAGGIFALLSLLMGLLVAVGMLATPLLVDTIVSFDGELRQLTIKLVRVVFPGTGLLVLSAWCLGVLNSHRRFFLSYASPVVWNGAMIAALLVYGPRETRWDIAEWLAYASVAGSALQFLIQVPSVLFLFGKLRASLDFVAGSPMRLALRNFLPILVSRGVVQVSAFVDLKIASWVSARVMVALSNAQVVYLLPISLFGMSVSVSELTEFSRDQANTDVEARNAKVRERLVNGQTRIAFFVVPSAVACLLLGDLLAGGLFQNGLFVASDTRLTWLLLMGSAMGLVAATQARLYSSAFYAFKETRVPLRFAIVRVVLGALLATAFAVGVPTAFGIPKDVCSIGLTLGAGLAAWMEFFLLRREMEKRIGRARPPEGRFVRLWGAALVAAAVGLGIKVGLNHWAGKIPDALLLDFLPTPPALPVLIPALAALSVYGVVYFALTFALRIPQSELVVRRVLRLKRRA